MPSTLNELLQLCTVPVLKDLVMNLDTGKPTGRKEELIQQILDTMLGSRMKGVWQRLDSLQQAAISEATHDPTGAYVPRRFRARYGRDPAFTIPGTKSHGYSGSRASALGLFIHFRGVDRRYLIPDDLRKTLITFVPKPEPLMVKSTEEPAEFADQTVRLGERDALQEVMVMLRLVEQSRLAVSEKTALPSAAAMRALTEKLVGGDFYPWIEKKNTWDQQVGPIRAFAWPLLLQAGGLVTRVAGRLTLSPAGTKALSTPPAEVLRTLWRKWLKTSLLDEFSRIDEIKGQQSKGRGMTAVAPRRAAICDALASCPTGRWVDIDELSRFMVASDCVFEVSHDPWKLYLGDRQYGSLGHDGFSGWNILQGRYIAAVLLEYAATLGMVDVALIDPAGASDDFRALWGTDELVYLSRYDGLCAIRLTPLGAYILGIDAKYQPAPMTSTVRLSVMPSLVVNVVQGVLNGEEQLVLETWAIPLTPGSWRLDRDLALSAIEKGHDIAELQAFLQNRDDMPLPDTVESLIRHCQRNGNALKLQGNAHLIQCMDESMADLLASHKETAELCLRAAPRMLVVRSQHLEKFRDRARMLGLGMAA